MAYLFASGIFVLLPATTALLLASLFHSYSCHSSYSSYCSYCKSASTSPTPSQNPSGDWRLALALSATAIVAWATAGTCLLSLSGALHSLAFILWWGLALAIAFALWSKARRPSPSRLFSAIQNGFRNLSRTEIFVLLLLSLCLLASWVMGAFSPPNNCDSLIYHLPRQLFWISQGTVFPEFMPYGHMQKMPPLTEWLGLNFYLLTGGDRWHFLVQWCSMLLCLLFLSAIIRENGGSRLAQLLGNLFFASIPAAFLQASNSKNDLFLSAVILGCSWLGEKWISSRRMDTPSVLLAGVWAGFGILAKGTAIAYLPIVATIQGSRFLLSGGKIRFLPLLGALLLCVFIGASHYAYQAKNILAAEIHTADSAKKSDHANGRFSLATGSSVFLRNYAVQLALPWDAWNRWLEKITTLASEKIGIPVNDPDSTFGGQQFAIQYYPTSEDVATAFLHFSLPLFLLLGGFFFAPAGRQRNAIFLYALAFFLAVFLFSFLFRWQPWHSRLLIPSLAFAAPSFGLLFSRFRPALITLLCLLLFSWLAPSFSCWARPIFAKSSVFTLPEDGLVGRANGGSVFLTSIGKTLKNLGATSVYFDLENSPIHAAVRYLPQGTHLFFPQLPGDPAETQAVLTNLPDTALAPETWERIQGKQLVCSLEGWRLWIAPSLLENADSLSSDSLPVFFRITPIAGIGILQGPYPDHGIPVFANAYEGGSSFALPPSSDNATLFVEASRFSEACNIDVFLDDDLIGSIPLDNQTSQATRQFPLPPSSFPAVVTLLPDRAYPSQYDPHPVAFRLRKLQSIPPKKTSPSTRENSGTQDRYR